MIPKTIHYCWFGGAPKPESVLKCIESWRKFCPDFEIVEWNESNYDVNKNKYMQQAYESRKWGFVPDYARLDIVYQYGGVYLDTDVELIRPINDLLKYKGFMGFERKEYIALGLGFGAEQNNDIIKEMMSLYDSVRFINLDGTYNLLPSPSYSTKIMLQHGLQLNNKYQMVEGIAVFPTEYFCPLNFQSGRTSITDHTYSIHWYDASWFSPERQYELRLKWRLNRMVPNKVAYYLARFIATIKFQGFCATIGLISTKLKKGRNAE